MVSKGKQLYDNENNLYTVVRILGRVTILYNHAPKEYIVARPLRLDSNGILILNKPGIWWVWSYAEAIQLVEYIKYNG